MNRLLPDEVTVFASGANRSSDIRGCVAAGVPIGVDVSKLGESAIRAVLDSKVPVLLDSGAFGEVSMKSGALRVVRPLDNDEWNRRLDIYLRIAKNLGSASSKPQLNHRVMVVAPDRVGSQELTLSRLSKFREKIVKVHGTGAQIIVPLLVGRQDFAAFYAKAVDVLGIDVVPGLPMKKAASPPGAIVDFVTRASPRRIHLLGMGATNPNASALIRLIRHLRPEILISLDSNRIRAGVGQKRRITRKEEQYRDDFMSGWTGEVDLTQWGGALHDMTELLFQPSGWLSPIQIEEISKSLTWLTDKQRNEFVRDVDRFVSTDENATDWLFQLLMQTYAEQLRVPTREAARTRAVFEALSNSKIGGQYG